ncbi:MAG TPA: hypothetical protein VJG64_03550 [Candidatus Paceibacterota bacterium]
MKLVRGVLVLLLFVVAMLVGWFYLAKVPFLRPSFLPAPTSVDQIPQNVADTYRATQDPWGPPSKATLQFCTNGFGAVYKFTIPYGEGKRGMIFDTAGSLRSREYRGELPEDNDVPAQSAWYKLYGNCTDLATLFK